MTSKLVTHVVRQAFATGDPVLCEYCQRPISLDVSPTAHSRATGDHRIPRSRGGHNTRANIAVSCYWCNHIKGPLTADEFLAVRHDRHQLRLIRAQMTRLMAGLDGPVYGSYTEKAEEKHRRRQERLAERLRPPDRECADCDGTGRYKDRRGIERHCQCALTPLDPERAAAHIDGRRARKTAA